MSSEYIILQDIPHVETQEWAAAVETPTRKLTLSLAKPETAHPDSGFLTPNAIRNFTEQQVKVFAQFGFGNHNPFSDTEYADAGAEFSHHYTDLSVLSNLIFKFDAFTAEQISFSKESQILVSILPPAVLSQAYIEAVNKAKWYGIPDNTSIKGESFHPAQSEGFIGATDVRLYYKYITKDSYVLCVSCSLPDDKDNLNIGTMELTFKKD